SDEIVAVRLEALALAAVRHPDHPAPAVKLRASTTYPVTGRPPVWSGSSHVRLAVRSTSRALSPTGTPGTAAGTAAMTLAAPLPTAFLAASSMTYSDPPASPV